MDGYYKTVTKRTAFAIRYTSMTLMESLSCDVEFLNAVLEQVSDIVKEENRVK